MTHISNVFGMLATRPNIFLRFYNLLVISNRHYYTLMSTENTFNYNLCNKIFSSVTQNENNKQLQQDLNKFNERWTHGFLI